MSDKLPRIWFKKEMADAILSGKKTATTRDHPKETGEYQAVTGSYYDAKPFATIYISFRAQIKGMAYSLAHFREEGFDSVEQMQDFLKKSGLSKKYTPDSTLYYHSFYLQPKQEQSRA